MADNDESTMPTRTSKYGFYIQLQHSIYYHGQIDGHPQERDLNFRPLDGALDDLGAEVEIWGAKYLEYKEGPL